MAINPSTALALSLNGATTKMQKRLAGALTPHGLSFTEYLVLRQLASAPQKRLRRIDLADTIGLSASGVTRLLNPMEKVGLVKKEAAPRDARVSLVGLTPTGEQIYRESDVSITHAADDFFAALDEHGRQKLSRLAMSLL